MIEVLIADSHVLVRKGIRALLMSEPDIRVVGEAGSYAECIAELGAHRVDVLIFDMAMSGSTLQRDSLELLDYLRRAQPRTRSVVLTMHAENEYAARALRAGAHGYITKDVTPELLLTAVRRVASGGLFLSPNIAESLALRVALQNGIAAPHERLSKRERAVFGLLADGRTINDIAQQLMLSAKTVSAHKLNVLRKMNLRNVAELVRYAIEHRVSMP